VKAGTDYSYYRTSYLSSQKPLGRALSGSIRVKKTQLKRIWRGKLESLLLTHSVPSSHTPVIAQLGVLSSRSAGTRADRIQMELQSCSRARLHFSKTSSNLITPTTAYCTCTPSGSVYTIQSMIHQPVTPARVCELITLIWSKGRGKLLDSL